MMEWRQHLDIWTEEDGVHQLDRAAPVTIFRLRTGHCQLLDIGTEEDSIHQLDRAAQVTIFRLRTGHCQLLDIGTEEDSIHQLDRAAQVTIFRLRTGHCQLLSHLRRLNISHSDECPCSTGPQTPNHILQSCPTFDALRRQTWPSPADAHRKLRGPVETLRQTADFALLNGLKI